MISSYNAAALHMDKARSKAKGRPMKGTGWRLYQDGDEYVATVYDVQIGRFLPDNTFMFTVNGVQAYRMAHTLSGTMHRNLPFHWAWYAFKAYRVDHNANMNGCAWKHFASPTNAPAVYDGLKFDLTTGRCLNPRPDHKRVVDPDRRKDWLAAVRSWKRKLKVIARIGGLDGLIAQEKANPTSWADKPQWNKDQWLDILYKAIKTGDYSTDLLRMFIASETKTWETPTSMQMYERIDKIIGNNSVELRRRFGVFKGDFS